MNEGTMRRIRPKAVAIIRDAAGRLLVSEAYDSVKRQTFYLPLGGGIEFGETGAETIVREMREEISAEVESVRYRATIENIFTGEGEMGHEIVLVYDVTLADRALYAREVIAAFEPEIDQPFEAVWKPLSFFAGKDAPLYPDGFRELLEENR